MMILENEMRKIVVLFCTICLIIAMPGCAPNGNSSTQSEDCNSSDFVHPSREAGIRYLDFIAVGDTGNGDDKQRAVADAMADYAAGHNVSFTLLLGDNFYPDGVESVTDSKFRTHFEEIYHQPSLNIPFYVVAGNHDYKGSVQAQLDYVHHSERWLMPDLYFTFTVTYDSDQTVQFFALDTNPIATWRNVDEQLAWLENELDKSTARWKIVYGHHPIYSNGLHGNNTRMMNWVFPLLEQYGVDLYVSGHDHDMQILKPVSGSDLYFTVSGAGCSSRAVSCKANTLYSSQKLGFMGLRLSHNELVITAITRDGTRDYSHVINK